MCIVLAPLTGCGDITGRGPADLSKTVDPALREQHPRVGYVYCMRGFLGIWSIGMDILAEKIDTQVGTPAVSLANEERDRLKKWIVEEYRKGQFREGPLVLLGHSYGADDMIRVAEHLKLEGMTVDLLVLIDPVTPPGIPDNVKRAYCVYKSNPATDWYPAWRGVPASLAASNELTLLTNTDLRITDVGFDTAALQHPTIDKSEGIHNMVMKEIEQLCPTRTAWFQQNRSSVAPVTRLPSSRINP
jgi:pimeloyl-ACP methyl ester carboxylesterase